MQTSASVPFDAGGTITARVTSRSKSRWERDPCSRHVFDMAGAAPRDTRQTTRFFVQ